MDSPKISVIIPVYNVELYIQECIESLLDQTFRDFEFIFVNDGSTDNSKAILESYLELDSRITLINQSNQGVSVARNAGLVVAKGEYIGFVDSDDWVELDMYQTLLEGIQKNDADLVLCNMFGYVDGKKSILNYHFPSDKSLDFSFIQNELWPYLIEKDDLYSSCNKLFKNSIIQEYAITFPEGNALSEDNIFNLKYFGKIKKFLYLDYTGYHYREVAGSAMRNMLGHNYFENIISLYHFNFKSYLDLKLTDNQISIIKGEKLINNAISLVHLYFIPRPEVSFFKRVKLVKKMLNNKILVTVVKEQYDAVIQKKGRFEKLILSSIKNKSVLMLALATSYSRMRNK